MKHFPSSRGFSLIEMLVAVAIFAVVMTMALGALLAMAESDRRAQTLKSVVNNLNFVLDSMSRSIRTGQSYHCDTTVTPITTTRDCAATSANSFAYLPSGVASNRTIYRLETTGGANAALCGQPLARVGCILRSTDGGTTYSAVTSSEVYITTLHFNVLGSTSGDFFQPKLTIRLAGEVTTSATQKSVFNLQTSITQRLYDR